MTFLRGFALGFVLCATAFWVGAASAQQGRFNDQVDGAGVPGLERAGQVFRFRFGGVSSGLISGYLVPGDPEPLGPENNRALWKLCKDTDDGKFTCKWRHNKNGTIYDSDDFVW